MRELLVNKRILLTGLLVVCISLILELYYRFYVSVEYVDMGFVFRFNALKFALGKLWLIILILIGVWVNKRSEFISAVYLFLLLLIYLPGHILFSYTDGSYGLFFSSILFFGILAVIGTVKLKIPVLALPESIKFNLLVLFAIFLIIPVVADFGLRINPRVFLLQDIYVVRAVFKESQSFFTSYSFWWLSKVVLPVLMLFAIQRKKWFWVLFSILCLIYLFLISGHKSVYFTPLMLLFFYKIGENYKDKIYLSFVALFLFLILINIPDLIVDRPLFKSIFIRRMLFVPSLLNEYYFDFFNGQPVYLSHSVLSSVSEYPYELSPAYLIADVYFNKPDMSSNTGIIADGFMNFGYWGVILYSSLFAIFMSILNSVRLNKKFFGLIVFYLLIFRGSAFLTAILTHGFWIVILLAFIVLPEKKKSI